MDCMKSLQVGGVGKATGVPNKAAVIKAIVVMYAKSIGR